MRPPNRSTAAIVAAVLAACGGAVAVTPIDENVATNEVDGSRAPDAVTSPNDAVATDGDSADAGSDADSAVAMPCPPIDDPYWDQVFERSALGRTTTWGDAAVCGVLEAGQADRPALVNAELGCVLVAKSGDQYPFGDAAGCPLAICSRTGAMGLPCVSPYQIDGDGGWHSIVGDAGECVLADDAAPVRVGCGQAGRRPSGYEPSRAGSAVAQQAALELASVIAFEELAGELRAFGAPDDLVEACVHAAREETTHARIMTAFAQRMGAHVLVPHVSAAPPRSFFECARDNVVEGLVRETMAAAIALHHAKTAAPDVRVDLSVIARDEISHADLSRRIHAWMMTTLAADTDARLALSRAMAEAIDDLAAEIPSDAATRAIFASLRGSIWREELAALG